jgi:hypothetical protein
MNSQRSKTMSRFDTKKLRKTLLEALAGPGGVYDVVEHVLGDLCQELAKDRREAAPNDDEAKKWEEMASARRAGGRVSPSAS